MGVLVPFSLSSDLSPSIPSFLIVENPFILDEVLIMFLDLLLNLADHLTDDFAQKRKLSMTSLRIDRRMVVSL